MKGLFGLISLLLVLVITGVLVKKQLGSGQQAAPAVQVPAVAGVPAITVDPNASAPAQSQQVQQQFKQAVEGALQAPRPMQDDK
jgi:hypothetical protein